MELKRIKELVVYRDLWVRGGGTIGRNNQAGLLNRHGMCCLGFAGLAVGVDPFDLNGHGEPDGMGIGEVPGLVDDCGDGDFCNSELASMAVEINDDGDVDDAVREQRLIYLFASTEDIALTFEDIAPESLREAYRAGLPTEGK